MKKNVIRFKSAVLALILCLFAGSSLISASEVQHMRVLTRGTDLYGTVTVRFSPDGDMFVVDAFSNRLLRMDYRTGKILEVVTGNGLEGPADIAFLPDGTMFWVNPFVPSIWKKTPDGVSTEVVRMTGMLDGVAVREDGRLFTASFDGRNELYEIDPNGVEPPRVVCNAGGLDAFDFGPDGYLYAPDFLFGSGNVFKIDVDSGAIQVLASGFKSPISVRVNDAGEVCVLDTGAAEMIKVDAVTGAKTFIASITPNADNFDFGPDGSVYIANNADSFIEVIKPNGVVLALTKPGLSSPGGIGLGKDAEGKDVLYVGDAFAMRRIDLKSGVIKETYYTDLGNPFAAVPPVSLSMDGNNIIGCNFLFNLVQVYDPVAGVTVEMYNDFAVPVNALRFQGELIVAELGSGCVVKGSDHTPIISGLYVPAGLAASDDDVWVGDWASGIIWLVIENGQVLGQPVPIVFGLDKPEGITVDKDGTLLVVETGTGRLLRVDPISGNVSVVAENLEVGLAGPGGTPPTWVAMSSVAISDSGALYVTCDVGNCVYKIWWTGI